jgi:hypothetical protein
MAEGKAAEFRGISRKRREDKRNGVGIPRPSYVDIIVRGEGRTGTRAATTGD